MRSPRATRRNPGGFLSFSDRQAVSHGSFAKWEGIGFQTRHEGVRFVQLPLRSTELQRFTVKVIDTRLTETMGENSGARIGTYVPKGGVIVEEKFHHHKSPLAAGRKK